NDVPAAATWARQDILEVHPSKQRSPFYPRSLGFRDAGTETAARHVRVAVVVPFGACAVWLGKDGRCALMRLVRLALAPLGSCGHRACCGFVRHNEGTPCRIRCEDTRQAQQWEPGWGNQGGNSCHEGEGLEHKVRRSVLATLAKPIRDAA